MPYPMTEMYTGLNRAAPPHSAVAGAVRQGGTMSMGDSSATRELNGPARYRANGVPRW